MNLLDLSGRVAVVTGGAKGIGAASVALLQKAGATPVIVDIAPPAGGMACDVTDEAAVKQAFSVVFQEYGGIDLLVNSAGRAVRRPATELSLAEWDQVLDLNLKGTFVCSRLAAPYMKQRGGGAIVNLASIMGLSGGLFPNASYQASKGGVVNLTRALALEWAADNIRVNAVAPSFVRTDFTAAVFDNPELMKTVMSHTPLGRLPEVDDIAAAILFLCSSAARCITGVTLPVDSGYLAR